MSVKDSGGGENDRYQLKKERVWWKGWPWRSEETRRMSSSVREADGAVEARLPKEAVREQMEKSIGGGEGEREGFSWWWFTIREWRFWRSFVSEAERGGGEALAAAAKAERSLADGEERRIEDLGRRRNAMARV